MASRPFSAPRVLSDGFDRLVTELASWSPRAAAHQLWRFFAPPGLSTLQRIWRLFWLPFWIWSDIPAPIIRSYPALASDRSASGDRLLAVLRSLARRHAVLTGIAVLFRAATLWAVAGGIWALIDMAGGPYVDSRRLILLATVIMLAGIVLAIVARPRAHDVARMLDRSFGLNDRVTTGLEQVTGGTSSAQSRGIDRLQIADATNTAVALAPRQSIRVLLPVREPVLATSCILIMAALLLMRGTGAGIPPLRDAAVPSFVTAKDRLTQQANVPGQEDQAPADAPSVEEVQERADSSAAAQQDLLALADSLDDNPLTKPVADAIRAGNYDQAAAELAEIASELDTLSPEARQELADSLDQAADSMSGDNPELQQEVEETADSLRTGENTTENATELSEEVQKTGEKVVPQEELASDMHEARTSGSEEGSGERTGDTQLEAGDEGQSSNTDPSEAAPDEGQDASGGQGSDSESSQNQSSDGSGEESDTGSQEGGDSESSTSPLGEEAGGEGGQSMGGGESGTSQSSSGEGGESQAGEGDAEGGQTLPDGDPTGGSNDNAEQGSGAGSGGGESDNRQTSNSAESRPGTGSDGEPDPNVVETEAESGSADQTEVDPSTSITLSRSPDETGYQAGGASGSSSSGSGQGAAAGSGSVEQGDVGVAGPDANRVPDEYRSTVEEYFSGDR